MASADEMKSRELQSWVSVAPGWRKHDKRLTEAFGGVSLALLDKAGVKSRTSRSCGLVRNRDGRISVR